PVIERVPVAVMDVLVARQRASEMFLHDVAMLTDSPTVDDLRLVSVRGFPGWLQAMLCELREMHLRQAGARAVRRPLSAVAGDVARLLTNRADLRDAVAPHFFRFFPDAFRCSDRAIATAWSREVTFGPCLEPECNWPRLYSDITVCTLSLPRFFFAAITSSPPSPCADSDSCASQPVMPSWPRQPGSMGGCCASVQ